MYNPTDKMQGNKTMMIAIAAIAIVAIAAVAAFALMGGGSNDSTNKTIDGKLWVLGNADGDTDIDNDDVKYVEGVIKSNNLSSEDKIWCDANYDGKVDSKDVEFIKNLIAGTSKTINYLNIDNQYVTFNVPDSSKPVYLVLDARCLAEEVLMVTNRNADHYQVVAASKQCFDYDAELQFSKQTNPKIAQFANGKITPEEVATWESQYKDGSLVLCMGSKGYYNDGLEEKISSYGNAQIIRLPSWEGNTLSGTLTFGYLLGSQGKINGLSSWQMAQDYAEWNIKYTTKVTEAIKDIKDKKTMINVWIKEADGVYTYQVQLPGSDSYHYSVKAGADNLGPKFGGTATNIISVTKEDIAAYAKDVDVIVVRVNSDIYKAESQTNAEASLQMGVKALNGYVSPDSDIFAMGVGLFNGTPYVISMVLYAKYMYDDVEAISKIDYNKMYSEWVKLIGWEDRDLSYVCMTTGPQHTTTKV